VPRENGEGERERGKGRERETGRRAGRNGDDGKEKEVETKKVECSCPKLLFAAAPAEARTTCSLLPSAQSASSHQKPPPESTIHGI